MKSLFSCRTTTDAELQKELRLAYQLIESLEKEIAGHRSDAAMKEPIAEATRIEEEDYFFLVSENDRLAATMKSISSSVIEEESNAMYRAIKSLAEEMSNQRDRIFAEEKVRADVKELIQDTFEKLLTIFMDLSSDIILRHRENSRKIKKSREENSTGTSIVKES